MPDARAHPAHCASISRSAAAIAGSSRRAAKRDEGQLGRHRHALDDRQRMRVRFGQRGRIAREREPDARLDQIQHRLLLVDLGDLRRLRAGFAEAARQQPVMRGLRRRPDPRQCGERAPVLRALHALLPAGRCEHPVLELRERDGVEQRAVARIVLVGPADVVADIERLRAHLFEHPARHAVPQRGLDLRMGFDQRAQEAAEAQELRVEDRADPQPAAHFVAQRGGRALHVGGRRERALRMRQQRLAVAREREPARRAGEQHDAERRLQVLDLQADGRLRQVQLLGGARQVAFAGDGREGAQQGEVHRRDRS